MLLTLLKNGVEGADVNKYVNNLPGIISPTLAGLRHTVQT